jgi:hypothetical protein
MIDRAPVALPAGGFVQYIRMAAIGPVDSYERGKRWLGNRRHDKKPSERKICGEGRLGFDEGLIVKS